jgi:hypothetical protein
MIPDRNTISARFLLAALPARRSTTVVPDGFVVTKLPAKVANGARKPRSASVGGGQPTGAICATPTAVRAYASTATFNRR